MEDIAKEEEREDTSLFSFSSPAVHLLKFSLPSPCPVSPPALSLPAFSPLDSSNAAAERLLARRRSREMEGVRREKENQKSEIEKFRLLRRFPFPG